MDVLVSVMGVQYTKKGTLAAILLFAKKLWFLLIAITAAILAAVKKFFRLTCSPLVPRSK